MTRIAGFTALILLCGSAFADCREASGGRMQGLNSPVIWHARTACGGSTMVWLRSIAGAQGDRAVWRVDDLLIVPDQENAQVLSLFAAAEVECRHTSDRQSLAIATGEWKRGAAPGERQSISRAWRMDAKSRKIEEVQPKNVICVVR